MKISDKFYHNKGNTPLINELPDNCRILDCGCGAGDNARILLSKGCQVTGITISEKEKKVAEDFCEKVFLANLEDGIPNSIGDKFDVILMSHVLEHLHQPNKLLQDAREFLTPAGIIAVALPNVLYYKQRFKFLLGEFKYTNSGLMDNTHVHFYTFETGRQLLSQNGYTIEKAWASGSFPLSKFRDVLLSTQVAKIDAYAVKKWPGVFGYQLMYLAR